MLGTPFLKAVIGTALLFGGVSISHADSIYDRKLEQAVKAIVAKKVGGPLRGSLEKEWRPVSAPLAIVSQAPGGRVSALIDEWGQIRIGDAASQSVSASVDLFGRKLTAPPPLAQQLPLRVISIDGG